MIVGGIDIGGTKISVGLVDQSGRLLDKRVWPTQAELGLAAGVARIRAALDELSAQSGVRMDGLGIGCTGPIDPLTGTLGQNTFMPGWEGRGLVEALEQIYGLPPAMENDADSAALAEGRWGSGKGSRVFVYLTVSTGIGGGMLIDGRLYRGAAGAHPEVGHHIIDPSGPACFCGAHGCWESLASGPALARWYAGQLPADAAREGIDAREVCRRAEAGDALAEAAVARTAHYLGVGLANLINFYTPDRIALGGGLMNSWHLFAPTVQALIPQICGLVPYASTAIALASLGPDTGLLGAAQAWFHRNAG